jgi:hypothetical protein
MEQTLLFKGAVAFGCGFVAFPVIQVLESVLGDSGGKGLLRTVIWLADGMESLVKSYPVVLLAGALNPKHIHFRDRFPKKCIHCEPEFLT